jgi:ABC-type transporter Mla subunit MlaD
VITPTRGSATGQDRAEWEDMRPVRSVGLVRLPSVPGPSDVLSAVGGVKEGISEALALVPRVGAAVGRMEELLGRAAALLSRVEELVDRVDDAIDGVAETGAKADAAIDGIAETRAKADTAIDGIAETRAKADESIAAVSLTQVAADAAITAVGRTTSNAEALVGRVQPLVDDYVQPLADLAPSMRRLAATLEPQEVEALVQLIDRMPRLVAHLDEDILPVLESLGNVGTDVHDLVDTVQDLRQIVKGFPGSRLFRRRGAEEIAQEEADEPAQDGARRPVS